MINVLGLAQSIDSYLRGYYFQLFGTYSDFILTAGLLLCCPYFGEDDKVIQVSRRAGVRRDIFQLNRRNGVMRRMIFSVVLVGCVSLSSCGLAATDSTSANNVLGTGSTEKTIEPSFENGAVAAAEALRQTIVNDLGDDGALAPADEWNVTIELDKRIAPGLTRRPLKLNSLVDGFMKDVADQAIVAEIRFMIGNDPVRYSIDLGSQSDIVLIDLLDSHLTTMQNRATELGKTDPPPNQFRLTALVVPAKALDALKGPKDALIGDGQVLSLNVGPSRQPSVPPGQSIGNDADVTGDLPTSATNGNGKKNGQPFTTTTTQPEE